MKTNEISVVLADDHPVYRDGLRLMLECDSDISVVGETSSGREAVRLACELQPRVILLDINMPDMNGAAVAKAVRDAKAPSAIMFVTMEKSVLVVQQAIDLGIDGYILKNSGAKEITQAVRIVAGGEQYYCPAIASMLMNRAREQERFVGNDDGLSSLTPSERKVLGMVDSNRTSKEIASDLGVSVRTIEGHRARISNKLGLSGAHSLVKYAFEHRDQL